MSETGENPEQETIVKELLQLILIELKKNTLHQEIITDNHIRSEEINCED